MKQSHLSLARIIIFATWLIGCGDIGVNRTIQIADGEKRRGDLNSVNGAVIIGKNCEIEGSCRAVNGKIVVDESSTVHDLMSINGSITVKTGVRVQGEITAVNGSVQCEPDVVVKEEISTINGDIRLDNSRVAYDILILNGDVLLHNRSVVDGDVVFRKEPGRAQDHSSLQITISDSSIVAGSIINRDENREVSVLLTTGGQVKGKIQNVDIVRE
jgi:hypothetical protein